MPQRVLAARPHALVAAAAHVVRHGQRRAAVQQQLDDLVAVAVRRQDQGSDVRRERRSLRGQRLPALESILYFLFDGFYLIINFNLY